MKSLVKLLSLAVGLFLSSFAYAQDNGSVTTEKDKTTFTIGGQYKPRFEFRNGFKRPILDNQNPAYFVEQRARLWADYRTSKFQIHINLQDVRMWGATNQIYKSDGTANGSLTNVYEAFGTYFINANLALKVGRQELDYDNARFLGNLDWAMQGRSHDGVVLIYDNNDGYKLHVGGALNQFQSEPAFLVAAPYNNSNYKNMAFLWLNKDWGDLDLSFLFHNDGRENNAGTQLVEYHRQTVALIPTWNTNGLKVGGEFYYQFGKNVGGQDISALFINAYVTLKTDVTPITIGGEYASGTQWDSDGTEDNSWNPLYGTNHKFYGYMDYFYVGNAHGQFGRTSGLVNLFLKFKFNFNTEKHMLAADLHYFMSPVEIVNLDDINNAVPNPRTLRSGLGAEIDLTYKVALTKGVTAFVAYSQMFASESMNHIKPINGMALPEDNVAGLQNWVWLGMNFTGDLFTFKN